MAEARARLIVEIKDQATAQSAQMFNALNGQMARTVTVTGELSQAQQKSTDTARSSGLTFTELASKFYLVQQAIRAVVGAMEGLFEFGRMGAVV